MKRIRIMVVGASAAMTIAGVGIATAGSTAQAPSATSASAITQVIQQLDVAEQRAATAGNVKAVAALQQAKAALQARQAADGQAAKGKPTNPPPPCPSKAPNAGRPQPCGKDHNTPRPTPTATATTSPTPSPTRPTTPPPAACGVASEGGLPAEGPISGVLYGVGVEISNNGGAPLGDLVQTVACAVYDNLGL